MPEGSPANRRTLVGGASLAAAVLAIGSAGRAADTPRASAAAASSTGPAQGVDLHWLDGRPDTITGTAWGAPLAQGSGRRGHRVRAAGQRRQPDAGTVLAAPGGDSHASRSLGTGGGWCQGVGGTVRVRCRGRRAG